MTTGLKNFSDAGFCTGKQAWNKKGMVTIMKIGYALTGSFCTVSKSLEVLKGLTSDYEVIPIVSPAVFGTDTRFAKAEETIKALTEICGIPPVNNIKDAEPFGPSVKLDALIISPCTGNTLAKLANGITDTSVTMAAKAHLRNDRPLIIALATNDGLSQNLKNIAALLTRKSVFFVPFGQDSPVSKPHSLVCDFKKIPETLDMALAGVQLQPLLN